MTLSQIRTSRLAAPALLVLLGIVWRLIWLLRQRPFEVKDVEAVNAAISFARTWRIADAIGPGEGLSVHLNPVMPALGGTVYRLFGVQTPLANWLLSLMALCFSLGTALMLYRAFGSMGASRRSRLLGLGLYCLLPLAPYTELMEFRHWEGSLATLLASTLLALIAASDAGDATGWPRRLAIATLAAVLFFINPPLGLAGYAICAMLLWRKLQWRAGLSTVLAASVILAAVLAPWTIRNYQAFGRFVPIRGNAGLELALANHPAAVSGLAPRAVFLVRLREIHPTASRQAFARMQAQGGEIAYSEMLGAEAGRWIIRHPLQFARLTVRHLAQFYFPPNWLWDANASQGTTAKQALTWATALLGLIGAAATGLFWHNRFRYAAVMAVVPVVPYLMVQPVLRYRFILLGVLIYLTAEVVTRTVDYARGLAKRQTAVGDVTPPI